MNQWRTVDKSAWGPGPWHDEPDKLSWTDAATGLPCLIVRGPMGALCGYVGVPRNHPLYGTDYDDAEEALGAAGHVHGGLTFAARRQPDASDDVWWFGFDCAHFTDLCPKLETLVTPKGVYRDVAFVRGEIARLAAALAGFAP